MREFPHLTGATEFPGFGREVYEQIPGAYDSGEWQEGATITMLSVPWGVYDAQTETNVPGFDTPADRDNWFKNYLISQGNIESHVLDTRVAYQLKSYVELPFTFDYAARYNYMIVDYPQQPVTYGVGGLKRWFFHVTAIDYDSPSCTRVSITPDWWTTCVPLMTIKHMILERGHAPVAASDVDKYLSDPIGNADYLLSPDLDFGSNSTQVTHSDDLIFNKNCYALICTRGAPITGDYATYKLPIEPNCYADGMLADWQFACAASDLLRLLDAIHKKAPAMFECIDCVAFIGNELLTFTTSYTFGGINVYTGCAGKRSIKNFKITKEAFAYPEQYADLAKLYTFPYAHVEVTDERGNVDIINIEALSGSGVDFTVAFNAAYPWLKVSGAIANVGGSRRVLTFRNMDTQTFNAGGEYWQHLREWDVPCYSVIQSAAEAYDYRQKYNRDQAKLNADTAYANATASNATAYTNATASNATAYTNSANNAALVTTNNAVSVAASSAMTARSVNGNSLSAARANTKMRSDCSADAAFSSASYSADKDALGVAASNNTAQALGSAASTLLPTVAAGAATGAATGGAVGALAGGAGAIPGAVIGGLGGLVIAGVNYATSSASNNVSQSNNSTLYGASLTSIESKRAAASSYTTDNTNTSNNVLTDNTNTSNNAATSIASNTSSNIVTCAANTKTTADANAARTKNTADANAARTRDNAYSAIDNATANAGMQTSLRFGEMRGGDYNSTRPMVISCNVVTQSRSAIAQTAAQFKRWGYTLNQSWDLVTWNVMKHFSFWQVSDIWATGVGEVPEEGQDAVKRMLYTGVTCWRDPSEIGKVSIYDN